MNRDLVVGPLISFVYSKPELNKKQNSLGCMSPLSSFCWFCVTMFCVFFFLTGLLSCSGDSLLSVPTVPPSITSAGRASANS